jgi:hypothetical protein
LVKIQAAAARTQFKKGQSGNPTGINRRTLSPDLGSPSSERDHKEKHANSSAGRLAAKAHVSHHVANQALQINKGPASSNLAKRLLTRSQASTDSASQGIEKGRSRVAAEMVIKKGISQTEAAKRVGVTRQAVNKALSTENPQCGKEVDVPDHIAANKNSKTDFLKLSVAGQQKVRDGQPLNRVALAEGVRVKPTLIERARKLYLGMSEDEKRTFLKWAMTTEGGQV